MNTSTTAHRSAVILLVEDNDNDAELTKLGFAQCTLSVALHHVVDGEECMQFLHKSGVHADAPTPDLILLDLHMPRMNGIEVLAAVGRDDGLKHIPVVVLTTSDAPADVLAAYRLRCSSYIVKPVGFDAFAKTIEALTRYWLLVAALPKSSLSRHESPTRWHTDTLDVHSETGA
jgi:CheY-like chemotaxis protein